VSVHEIMKDFLSIHRSFISILSIAIPEIQKFSTILVNELFDLY
jgi:hypothetical protein